MMPVEEKNQKPRTVRGKYCETQRVATNKYLKENYFTVRLKRSDKERIEQAATALNMSRTAFIQDCIYRRVYEVLDEPNDKE